MRHFTDFPTKKQNNNNGVLFIGAVCLTALFVISLTVGKYPLSLPELMAGNELQRNVFWNLRFSRVLMGVIGGVTLGMTGWVYQTIFRNPLASPDIIGVSSGASAGAAAGILFFSTAASVTFFAFTGALFAVILALLFSALDPGGKKSTVVLAGIAVHALAQTVLMSLKLMADPERELASIEYWIMGSLSGIRLSAVWGCFFLCTLCLTVLFALHRQSLLLSLREDEAALLGVNVTGMRLLLLGLATLSVAAVVSRTGLISFLGLLAPHCARGLTRREDRKTLLLSGIIGGILLVAADIFARSASETELPVSIFTSLIGVPFLVWRIFRGGERG